ncbi:type II secretion system secretin GspD [Comamonas sp. GB3 AK4-5]|uniref:type II secretion system secretin GspD n=1 Tax=Comamonas sp. GB3 AK4-5 TaxID=3231487 RepID=UPI00351EC515
MPSSGNAADTASAAQQPSPATAMPVADATLGRGERVVRPLASSRAGGKHSTTPPPREGDEERVVLNFQQADIHAVIGALSRFLRRNFLMDPRVKGQIDLVSDGPIGAKTGYDMLVSALRMRGFTIVEVGNVSRVVPVADAKVQGGAVNDPHTASGIATRTFRLAYENADTLVPVLRPMIAPENSIAAYASNNTIVITDYVDNLERIASLIESIDTPASLNTEMVKIYNGVAVDIAGLANDVLQQQSGGGSGGGASGGSARHDIMVVADPRSNSILIRSSSPSRTALARDLVLKLDNAQDDPGNLYVVYLRNAQATALAGVLKGLLTGEASDTARGSDSSARAALGAGGMLGGAGSSSGTSPASSTSASNKSATGASSSGSQRFAGTGSGASSHGTSGNASGGAFSANGVTVQADAATNTLLISAPEPMYRSLRRVIDLLDQRRAQVLVESLIVEVTETDSAELGVQWMAGGGRVRAGTNLGGSGINTSATTTIDAMPSGLNIGIVDGSISVPGIGDILNLKMLANALESKGGANILSTPNILTLDNEMASIMVGKTIPFVTGSYVTSGSSTDNPFQTIQREDIGLKLNIRPQISEGGAVKLDIYQEVSSIDEASTSSSTSGTITNKRAIDTSVLLDDGQIMVLGGLMEDSVNNNRDAVPLLGQIPFLGALFRSDSRQRSKTNLMVFLRPYVIRDASAGRGLTQDRYNFMRAAQSRMQPGDTPLLPDLAAPILPPAGVPAAGRKPAVDLRPTQWEETRQQTAPPTQVSSEERERPKPAPSQPAVLHSHLPAPLGVTGDPALLYATPATNKTVVQVADMPVQEDAERAAKRLRVSGLPAYIVGGPGGMGFAVRVDLSRDASTVDRAIALLRELGYQPELVVTP